MEVVKDSAHARWLISCVGAFLQGMQVKSSNDSVASGHLREYEKILGMVREFLLQPDGINLNVAREALKNFQERIDQLEERTTEAEAETIQLMNKTRAAEQALGHMDIRVAAAIGALLALADGLRDEPGVADRARQRMKDIARGLSGQPKQEATNGEAPSDTEA